MKSILAFLAALLLAELAALSATPPHILLREALQFEEEKRRKGDSHANWVF